MDLQDRPAAASRGICLDRLRLAIDQAADAIMLTDIDGTITFVNAACASLTGYPASELVGRNPRVLGSDTHPPRFFRELTRTLAAGEAWRGEIVNRRADGSLYVEERTIAPVRDADGRLDGYVSIGRDVTDRHPRAVMAEHAGGRREPVAVPVTGGAATPVPEPIVLRRHNRLMPRDLALLRLLLAGRSLSEAAAELGVAIGTAKNRRHEVYQKLGVGSLATAARKLRELGIELDPPTDE